MQMDGPVEQLITEIHGLDRDGVVSALMSFRKPRLDFTEDFLRGLNEEQLRHILMAACLQARKCGFQRQAG